MHGGNLGYGGSGLALMHGKITNYRITQDVDSDSVQLVYKWLNSMVYGRYTLWLFHIAMGDCPFIDDLPIKNGDFPWLC